MADRKISELTEASSVAAGDYFHIVSNPATTPTNQRIIASNIFRQTYATTASYQVLAQSVMYQGASGHGINAGHFKAVANNYYAGAAGAANAGDTVGVQGEVFISNTNINVTGTVSGVKSYVDLGDTNSVTGDVYSASIEFSDSGEDRAASPTAFIKLSDGKTSASANVTAIIDVFPDSAYAASAGANVGPAFTTGSSSTAAGSLKILVNGVERYIQLYSDVPA